MYFKLLNMKNIKKILVLLVMSIGVVTLASNSLYAITNVSSSNSEATNDEFIDSVEAQNMNGTQTKTFNVYGRRMSNGKYWYFVKTATREFGIQYANNNKYKPFYIKIGEERWYFASQTLDLYSGKTDQW